ncbi:MAG: hypothetical protein A3J38_09135 [Gammaproteobacteria bacterium RIFCSPHIGHO2_12_FULL_45_9]|nr:MAG: hypothetical protein A3J38_09135 [Gammaproteobacteria bacterium RIFCSPHIGHO2_12_FULL_45_9]
MRSTQPQKKMPLGLLGAALLIVGSALLVVSAFLFPPLWIAAAIAGTGLLFCAAYGAYQLKVRYKATPPVPASIASLQPERTESVDVEAAPVAIASSQRINPFMLAERHGSAAPISVQTLLNLPEETPLSVCMAACRKQLLLWHPDQNADLRQLSDEKRTRLCDTIEFWLNVRNVLAETNAETCYIKLPNTHHAIQPNLSSDPAAARWTNIIRRCDDILAGYDRMGQRLTQLGHSYQQLGHRQEYIRQQHAEIRQQHTEIRQQHAEIRQGYAEIRQGYAEIRQQHAEIRQGYAEIRQSQERSGRAIKQLFLAVYKHIIRKHEKHTREEQIKNGRRFSFFEQRRTPEEIQQVGTQLDFQAREAKTRRHSF